MKLYNTLTRQVEDFKPLHPPVVTYYTCGLTVYDFAHIGNMRTYTNNDILKRTLTYLGYKVKHVMNITDVGHLTSDSDIGEDKLEKGAKKIGKTVWEVAQFYTDFFFKTLEALNIIKPDIICPATGHIADMIQLINQLKSKGYVYETPEAVYFDTSKFSSYGKLSGQNLKDKLKGARSDVYIDSNKHSPTDFALWFKRVGRFKDHAMHWDSPYGDGFPGWHIECSAMGMKYLGATIDIHAGGIDLIPVHHENEIAQSEGAIGKQFVNYWFHSHYLQVYGKKMSKSLNNFYTIDDVKKKGIEPLSLRLLFLHSHYRQPMNFTWESATATHEAYQKLKKTAVSLKSPTSPTPLISPNIPNVYQQRFKEALANDLQTPQAVAVMWEMLKSKLTNHEKLALLLDFDQVFGLKLNEVTAVTIPDDITLLAKKREQARKVKDFKKADDYRKQAEEKGYIIEDTSNGFRIKKSSIIYKYVITNNQTTNFKRFP